MALDHLAGAGVQVSRPRVIAKACPGGEHFAKLGVGKRRHVRPAAQEVGVARQHGLDRGLLQHDLAQPHPIGVWRHAGRGAPGQQAPLPVVPGKENASVIFVVQIRCSRGLPLFSPWCRIERGESKERKSTVHR